jgi:hypothetical protein
MGATQGTHATLLYKTTKFFRYTYLAIIIFVVIWFSLRALSEKTFSPQDKAAGRKDDLDESLHAYQYLADVTEAEAWLTEKEPLVTSTDYGKDEDSAQAMLKKHNAVMSDLEAYGTVVDQLRDQSKTCKVSLGLWWYKCGIIMVI